MELKIRDQKAVAIQPDMIGLFFEDINYAADGGLYAEMIENRSFEFLEAFGDTDNYFIKEDGLYGWRPYPAAGACEMQVVMGSPLSKENPHYLRFVAKEKNAGFVNKAYDGIFLKKDAEYKVTFFARTRYFNGNLSVRIEKDGTCYAGADVSTELSVCETYNYWKKFEVKLRAVDSVKGADFVITLSEPGMVEFDFISMMPADAVAGVFRKDIFGIVKDMHPGFIRFPGGCIVEGNTLENRYRFKDTLHEPWNRKNNWNRWAVHENSKENGFHSKYSHYNQTLGLGFYEYFLLCEMVGAKPLPVLNVGFACQYMSTEQVAIDSPEFQEFLQDALDLMEFANGSTDTYWGAVRAKMGHPEPFHLTMMGIGNEQWQTERADFFERYQIFEKTIHKADPSMKLIGSAGPDITSERYTAAWDFYRKHQDEEGFAYALDEHYYVKPEWLLAHTHFYDDYDRKIKVFAGEYAAHPLSGMNRPDANTLEGALSEAAFLTGVERNADVVVLASYAPLFARVGYAQWSPDMIWFDAETAYGSPSYYVQKMYASNMGSETLTVPMEELLEAEKNNIFYSLSKADDGTIIVKIVNENDREEKVSLSLPEDRKDATYSGSVLTGELTAHNSVEAPDKVRPVEISGKAAEGVTLPARSFTVLRLN